MSRFSFLIVIFFSLILPSYSQEEIDFFVLIGQSNMAGRSFILPGDTNRLQKVLLVNDELGLEPARNPLNRYSTVRKDDLSIQRLGPGYHFGKKLTELTGDTLAVLVNARGASNIERWLKGSEYGYYEATLNRIRLTLKNNPQLKLKAILWQQGESNRHNPEDYITKLRKMVSDFRTDLQEYLLPFLIGEMGKWNNDYDAIRAKILQVPDSIENSFLISSEGLSNMDVHHFDVSSYQKLGYRYAYAWYYLSANRMQKVISNDQFVSVTAHRGDWRNAPENSIQAIELAIDMGVDMVEVDVGLTKDSVLVLLHDTTVNRTTNCEGSIGSFNYESLNDCPLIDGLGAETEQLIPTLEQALRAAKDQVLINLDKAKDHIALAYPVLKSTNMTNTAIFSSYYSYEKLREMAGPYLDSIVYMPKIKEDTENPIQYLSDFVARTNTVIVQIRIPSLDYPYQKIIQYARESGLLIWINSLQPYHCAGHNDEKAIYQPEFNWGWIVDQGADFIQTDRPELLLNYLRGKGLHN